jgi:hypothetical protein
VESPGCPGPVFGTLAISFWPYMIPFSITIDDAAAPHASLAFVFWGAGLFVFPLMVIYAAVNYSVFRREEGRPSFCEKWVGVARNLRRISAGGIRRARSSTPVTRRGVAQGYFMRRGLLRRNTASNGFCVHHLEMF